MKHTTILVLLSLILLVSCQPSAQSIETAIAETQAANPTETFTPTKTSKPTNTPKPTSTPKPKPTKTPAPSVEDIRQQLLDALVSDLTSFEDVDSLTLVRFNEGALEIELKTMWASQDNQADVSWNVIRAFSVAFSDFDKDNLETVAGGTFSIVLTTYSVNSDYRYQSVTDWDTLKKLSTKSISYEEWLSLADARFK